MLFIFALRLGGLLGYKHAPYPVVSRALRTFGRVSCAFRTMHRRGGGLLLCVSHFGRPHAGGLSHAIVRFALRAATRRGSLAPTIVRFALPMPVGGITPIPNPVNSLSDDQ